MKLKVLKKRDKKFTVNERVVKKLKTVYTIKNHENNENRKNSKINSNDPDLENEKYIYQTNNKTITTDNVDWKTVSLNKALYKSKKETKQITFASYNYFSPLDKSCTNTKGKSKKNKNKMTTIDPNEDMLALESLNKYVNQMPDKMEDEGNSSKWEEVRNKQKDKAKTMINEQNSSRFVPRMLMPGRAPNTRNIPTSKKIQLTIKLRLPPDSKAQFNSARTLVAVMKTLQSIHPDTYLGTINTSLPEEKIIYDTDDISGDERDLTDYIAVGGDLKQMVAKMVIHTNHELLTYKISPQIRGYLARELLVIETNELASINPPNVGFMETVIARHETLELHKQRLLKKLPSGIPKFQLQISTLYVCSGTSCRIIMMKADPEDVEILQEEMSRLSTGPNKVSFFPWGEYLALTKEQKTNIVHHQLKWHGAFRSVILKGFKENCESIIMKTEDEATMETNEPSQDYLLQTTVTQYFRKHVSAGNGTNLFAYVYTPIAGTIEFIVKAQHDSEAKEYLKKAKSELAKRMTQKSIEAVFTDPEEANKLAESTPAWRPYTRALTLIPPTMPTGDTTNAPTKRTRNQESYIPPSNTSYVNVVNSNLNNQGSNNINIGKTTTDIDKKLEELKLLMEQKLEDSIKDNMRKTEILIDTKNDELKRETNENIKSNYEPINNSLDKLTTMFAYMQANQEQCNNNLMNIMTHIGIGSSPDKQYMEQSMEITFDKDCETPTKNTSAETSISTIQSQHSYNTRSKSYGTVNINGQNSYHVNPSNVTAVGVNQ
jgi:hypothetical protein